MLTDNKEICTSEYWNEVYSGKRNDTKTDASNNVRPKNAFDRFKWVADLVEGPNVLGIASGHARIERIVKLYHPEWSVTASDQSPEARNATDFRPYKIIDAYNIQKPFTKPKYDTIIATQCLEYMDNIPKFLEEARRVARKLITTAPVGIMQLWSQLCVFDENNLRQILEKFGEVEIEDIKPELMLYKIKFYE